MKATEMVHLKTLKILNVKCMAIYCFMSLLALSVGLYFMFALPASTATTAIAIAMYVVAGVSKIFGDLLFVVNLFDINRLKEVTNAKKQ